MRLSIGFVTVVLAISLTVACSPYGPVQGIVMLDGKPLGGATIIFHPENDESKSSNAATEEDGAFKLRTVNENGVLPGMYKVTVSKRVLPEEIEIRLEKKKEEAASGNRPTPPNLPAGIDAKRVPGSMIPANLAGAYAKEIVPFAYTRKETTPLQIEIPKGGKQDLRLEIKQP